MLRFLLYSLSLHLLIFFIILGFSFFTPKPKNIQIKLASLPKTNNIKKTISPEVANKQAEEKKAAEVQKLLDKVLKEDIKEKAIEKPMVKEVKKTETPLLSTSKPVEKTTPPTLEKIQESPKAELPKPIVTPKSNNIVTPELPRNTVENNQSKPVETTPNPYTNPILPRVIPQEPVKVEDNPYANPVFPKETPESPVIPTAPVLPKEETKRPALPSRKEIDVSSVKEGNLNEVVSSINETVTDIMSPDNNYLSEDDKKALSNQISQCLASIGMVRENTTEIILMFELQENAKIKDIKVIKDNKIAPANTLSNLESRVIYLFNNPKCSTLILPKEKFNYWQKFTIKINLKGLFE